MGRYGVYNGWYDPMVTRYTGPIVTRCIGGLFQLPEVKISWEKKSMKKFSDLNIIHFLMNFFRQTGYQGTRRNGGLYQDSVIKWAGKKCVWLVRIGMGLV